MITLTTASRPANLQTGEMTMVYEALTPYPVKRSLEDLVERCFTKEYEARIKKPPLTRSFLRRSILYHLKRMKERGIIREV